MGFFDKLKNFGSKVITGVRKGWDFVKNKVAPVVRNVLPYAQKAADYIPGAQVIKPALGVVDKAARFVTGS